MHITLSRSVLTVSNPGRTERIRGGTWGTPESAFWTRLKKALNSAAAAGFDVPAGPWIKVNPGKDGHLTGADWYLVTKKRTRYIFDHQYAVRCPAEAYNAGEPVRLTFETT